MSKKGPLSKIEKFYIQHNLDIMDLDQIASDLDRPKSKVKYWKDKFVRERNTKTTGAKAGESKIPNLIQSYRGSTVMTQAASELADATRGPRQAPTRTKNCVSTIKNE